MRSIFLQPHGSLAVRERKSFIAGLVEVTAVAMKTLKPVSKREIMTDQNVRSEVLIFLGWESGSFWIFLGYVSIKEPVV